MSLRTAILDPATARKQSEQDCATYLRENLTDAQRENLRDALRRFGGTIKTEAGEITRRAA